MLYCKTNCEGSLMMIPEDEFDGDHYQYIIDELTAGDSWRLFRILSEFVEGFDLLSRQEPMVSVFGSSRYSPESSYYNKAKELGSKLAEAGITVITGGGPGVMEAANRGAYESDGKSIGIKIDLPLEKGSNRYTTHDVVLRHFFVRKVMLIKYSQAFVIFPGGFGTFDELFEALTLTRTKKMLPFPIILIGSDYWEGLLDWLKKSVLEEGCIDEEDIAAIQVTDDLETVVRVCQKSIVESRKSEWLMKARK